VIAPLPLVAYSFDAGMRRRTTPKGLAVEVLHVLGDGLWGEARFDD